MSLLDQVHPLVIEDHDLGILYTYSSWDFVHLFVNLDPLSINFLKGLYYISISFGHCYKSISFSLILTSFNKFMCLFYMIWKIWEQEWSTFLFLLLPINNQFLEIYPSTLSLHFSPPSWIPMIHMAFFKVEWTTIEGTHLATMDIN